MMFFTKNYTISKNDYGEKITINGEVTQKVKDFIIQKKITGIELNYAKGWSGSDLFFLQDMIFLKSFEIIDNSLIDISPIHCLENLEYLSIFTCCKSAINFQAFPHLKNTAFEWRSKAVSVFDCHSLCKLFINCCAEKSLHSFRFLKNLESLCLKSPRLVELGKVTSIPRLNFLGIYNARKLFSLKGIECYNKLERLEVDSCKNIGDIEALKYLTCLKELWLCNCGEIASLLPLGSIKMLNRLDFHESTNILDGNLKILKDFPCLKSVSFQNRKHYNMKNTDFNYSLKKKVDQAE